MARTLVIGIGNDQRGDDAAGRLVARGLRDRVPDGIEVVEADGEASRLLDLLATAEAAYLVDAALSGAPPGTIHRLDAADGPLPRGVTLSSHGLGLGEALEIARALGSLPAVCIVHAIEGESFAPGAPLSPAVAAAALEVEERLRRELEGQRPKIEARPAR